MFRSTKAFADISCPYADTGLCRRPYCPYKHRSRSRASVVASDGESLPSVIPPSDTSDAQNLISTAPFKQSADKCDSIIKRQQSTENYAAASKLSGTSIGSDIKPEKLSGTTGSAENTQAEKALQLSKNRKSVSTDKFGSLEDVKHRVESSSRKRKSDDPIKDDIISISSSSSSMALTHSMGSPAQANTESDEMEYLICESLDEECANLPEIGKTATSAGATAQTDNRAKLAAPARPEERPNQQASESISSFSDAYKRKRIEDAASTKDAPAKRRDTEPEAAPNDIKFVLTQTRLDDQFRLQHKRQAEKSDSEAASVKLGQRTDSNNAASSKVKITSSIRAAPVGELLTHSKSTDKVATVSSAAGSSASRPVESTQKRFHDQLSSIRDGTQRVAEQQGKVRREVQLPAADNGNKPIKGNDGKKPTTASKPKQSNWQPPKLSLFVPKSYSGLPTTVRQPFLQSIFKRLCEVYGIDRCPDEEMLKHFQKRAHEIEETCATGCSSNMLYRNRVANALLQIQRERDAGRESTVAAATSDEQEPGTGSLSHADMLNGPKAQQCSFTYKRTEGAERAQRAASEREVSERELCEIMRRFIASESELEANGFPRPDPTGQQSALLPVSERDAANMKRRLTDAELNRGIRLCVRCGERFSVDIEHNLYLTPSRPDACRFHSSKPFKRTRAGGSWEGLFECCNGLQGSPGCKTHSYHVHDSNRIDPSGFVTTVPSSSSTPNADSNRRCGVLAIDCEMVYTVGGYELARISAVNARLQVVADWYVRPTSRVLDYNERFSGMRASFFAVGSEEYKGESIKTHAEAQAELLQLVGPDTLLMGHSLENDLLALRVVHSNIIDTSLLFPHKLGPPIKRSLRNLAQQELREIVQDGVEGHDSVQDARTCMKLVIKKLCDENGVTFSFADPDTL